MVRKLFELLADIRSAKGHQAQIDMLSRFDREIELRNQKKAQIPVAGGGENPLFAQFRSGAFNTYDATKFEAIVEQLFDLQMNAEEIKNGIIAWFAHDKTRLAA